MGEWKRKRKRGNGGWVNGGEVREGTGKKGRRQGGAEKGREDADWRTEYRGEKEGEEKGRMEMGKDEGKLSTWEKGKGRRRRKKVDGRMETGMGQGAWGRSGEKREEKGVERKLFTRINIV